MNPGAGSESGKTGSSSGGGGSLARAGSPQVVGGGSSSTDGTLISGGVNSGGTGSSGEPFGGEASVDPGDGGSAGESGAAGVDAAGAAGESGNPIGNCCSAHAATGCDDPALTNCVCNGTPNYGGDPFCCASQWDDECAYDIDLFMCGHCPEP